MLQKLSEWFPPQSFLPALLGAVGYGAVAALKLLLK